MKIKYLFFIGICAVMLFGCNQKDDIISDKLNAYLEESMVAESEIKDDESYHRYEQISQDNAINDEGYFCSDDVDYAVLNDKDAVHVTFADNNNIDVQYFLSPQMDEPLNKGGAYLHVNDCIYAKVQVKNSNTNAYIFSEFKVWKYDKNGEKGEEPEKVEPFGENGLVYQIPMSYKGAELSIIPLGQYTSTIISLNDFCKDNNGVEQELGGEWYVNGIKTTGNDANVSPVAPYTVTYIYDPNDYFFVGSNPNCLCNDEIDGIVSFEEYEPNEDSNSFSIELRKRDGNLEFDPNKYELKHASIEFKYQGEVINNKIYIPRGSKISYSISNVDDGYWLPLGYTGEVEVEKVSDVVFDLVYKRERVTVALPQPERGGTITYYLDGNMLMGDRVETFIGSRIMMTFNCKNGWTCDAIDGTEYTVASKGIQRINVDGRDVNDVFSEQQYKPSVSLTIDKSVGSYTEFSVKTVDKSEEGLKLANPNKTMMVFEGEVGTKNDLIISASNGALLIDEALKVEIKKETVNGSKEIDIQYIQKLPDSLNIPLYISNSSTVYKTIKVYVKKTKVVSFTNFNVDNGNVVVETADLTNNRKLNIGEVTENSRKIRVNISAKDGYYVKDSGTMEDYSDIMTYSKYISEINNIVTKHPIKKLCSITLDAIDKYGIVSYRIDGKAVSPGTYSLKEEQKLELYYRITVENNVIVRNSELGIFGKKETEETVKIPITQSLDGKKIVRGMYISVRDK